MTTKNAYFKIAIAIPVQSKARSLNELTKFFITAKQTCMPTRSLRRNGPIGIPKVLMTVSIL